MALIFQGLNETVLQSKKITKIRRDKNGSIKKYWNRNRKCRV